MNEVDLLVAEIVERHRLRDDILNERRSTQLRMRALCRRQVAAQANMNGGPLPLKEVKDRGNALHDELLEGHEAIRAAEIPDSDLPDVGQTVIESFATLADCLGILEEREMGITKALESSAKELPVWPWVESLRGVGACGLGKIVGSAGNLSNYSNPAKLWKRMGLAVINGERQRMVKDPELAAEMGYSPRRRAVMHVVGDAAFKCQGYLRDVYLERKEREIEKAHEEGLEVAPAREIPKDEKERFRSQGHIHNRALRYMEKRLLRELWRAWRDAE